MEENNQKEQQNKTPSKMARLAWPKARYGVIIAIIIIDPPINVFVVGISLIPKNGTHTQKIPPKTSVSERSVRSAAGK